MSFAIFGAYLRIVHLKSTFSWVSYILSGNPTQRKKLSGSKRKLGGSVSLSRRTDSFKPTALHQTPSTKPLPQSSLHFPGTVAFFLGCHLDGWCWLSETSISRDVCVPLAAATSQPSPGAE